MNNNHQTGRYPPITSVYVSSQRIVWLEWWCGWVHVGEMTQVQPWSGTFLWPWGWCRVCLCRWEFYLWLLKGWRVREGHAWAEKGTPCGANLKCEDWRRWSHVLYVESQDLVAFLVGLLLFFICSGSFVDLLYFDRSPHIATQGFQNPAAGWTNKELSVVK